MRGAPRSAIASVKPLGNPTHVSPLPLFVLEWHVLTRADADPHAGSTSKETASKDHVKNCTGASLCVGVPGNCAGQSSKIADVDNLLASNPRGGALESSYPTCHSRGVPRLVGKPIRAVQQEPGRIRGMVLRNRALHADMLTHAGTSGTSGNCRHVLAY